MATGIELIISAFCNATFCEPVYDNPLKENVSLVQLELQKLSNELNGKHLKIATYNNYPLSWTERSENGTTKGKGVAFILLRVLQKKFNFTYEVVTPKQNFVYGGENPEDSLLGLLNSSAVDMAAAFLPFKAEFVDDIDFSYRLDEGVWMMMLKRPKVSAAGSGLLAPFDKHVWYLILAAVLSYGPIITILTHLRSKFVKDNESYIHLSPSFWFVYGAFIKQGTSLAPEANTTRVLFATWWMFIILLSAFYTANLTAFLTLSKFTLDIENPKDLYKKNYRWVADKRGPVEFVVSDKDEELNFLYKMVLNGRARFLSYLDNKYFLPLVTSGEVLIKEATGIEHMMYEDYQRKAREGIAEEFRCTYVIAPTVFMELPRAFGYPKGSALQRLFDPVLSHLVQAGIVNFLERMDLPSTKICPLDLQSKDRKLSNSDLMMTYMIMAIGLAAAGAVFGIEILLKRYIRVKLRKNDATKKKKTRRIRFKDQEEIPPPPYESLFGRNPQYKANGKTKTKIINGREYYEAVTISGDARLIPVEDRFTAMRTALRGPRSAISRPRYNLELVSEHSGSSACGGYASGRSKRTVRMSVKPALILAI